jgi:hypothetical protein
MKVKTLGPVEFDGKKIKIGSTIDVSETAAEQLISVGAAELVDAKAAAKAKADADTAAAAAQAPVIPAPGATDHPVAP